jgi:hypothetical protein
MVVNNEFCEYYKDLLEGTYDSIDRIVINAYFRLAQSNGGFRTWWRMLMGNDDSPHHGPGLGAHHDHTLSSSPFQRSNHIEWT